LIVIIFKACVGRLDDIDTIAFKRYYLNGAIGVDELIDGMHLHGLTVDEGFARRGKTRDSNSFGSYLDSGLQLVDLTVTLFVEAKAIPCFGFHKPDEH
jgi:hypothetical protein